jgi:hypothetical protein
MTDLIVPTVGLAEAACELRWIPGAAAGEALLLATIADARVWMEPGVTGATFLADGRAVAETLRFARPANAPDDAARGRAVFAPARSRWAGELEEAYLAVDPGWGNYFHFLLLHLPLLRVADEQLAGGGPALWPRWEDHVGLPKPIAFARAVFDEGLAVAAATRPALFAAAGAWRVRRLHVLRGAGPRVADVLDHPTHWSALRGMAESLRAATPAPAAPARRLFLARGAAAARRFDPREHADLLAWLARADFEVVDLAGRGLREQAALLSEAASVIAPHGSALANLIFAPTGTRVLELNARVREEAELRPHFERLARRCGHRYRVLDGSLDGFPVAAIERAWNALQAATA